MEVNLHSLVEKWNLASYQLKQLCENLKKSWGLIFNIQL
jgi:hypothetical protein